MCKYKPVIKNILQCGISLLLVIYAATPSHAGKAKAVHVLKNEIPSDADHRADISFDYTRADTYALGASASDEKSVESLASYLSKCSTTDREKARAIYTWITERITYDTDSVLKRSLPDPSASVTLKNRRAVCEGISNLYMELALMSGLTCVKVTGYSKGSGYRPGEKMLRADHAWNAVKIDGRWRLVDATWGCGSVDAEGKTVKCNPSFWFLAEPGCMVYTHLPTDAQWTLLERTVTLSDFEKMANIEQAFFELGFDQSSLNAGTFLIKSSGPFSVSLSGGRGNVTAELVHSSGIILQQYDLLITDDMPHPEHRYVNCTRRGNTSEASVNITDAGTYELNLYSMINEKIKGGYSVSGFKILSYRVVIESGSSAEAEDAARQVATYPEFEKLGFVVSGMSHKNYGIKTDRDVRIELSSPDDTDALALIEHDGVELKELTFTQCTSGRVTIDCTFPHDGIYNMRIFAKKHGNPGSYSGIASYRFYVSGIAQRERCMFPKVLGDYSDSKARLVTPMSGCLKKNSTVMFKIEVPGAIEVMVASGSERVKLKKTRGDLYEGKVKVTVKNVSIAAMFTKGGRYPVLVSYEVY